MDLERGRYSPRSCRRKYSPRAPCGMNAVYDFVFKCVTIYYIILNYNTHTHTHTNTRPYIVTRAHARLIHSCFFFCYNIPQQMWKMSLYLVIGVKENRYFINGVKRNARTLVKTRKTKRNCPKRFVLLCGTRTPQRTTPHGSEYCYYICGVVFTRNGITRGYILYYDVGMLLFTARR